MSNDTPDFERRYENLSVNDPDNPKSVYCLAPPNLRQRIAAIPDKYFECGPAELASLAQPTDVDKQLRISFWLEYERAQRLGQLNLRNVFYGICSQTYFTNLTGNSAKLCYILTPPTEFQIAAEELLMLAIEQMREVMALPNLDDKGRPNTHLIKCKLDIYKDTADRRRGHVLRRLEVENTNRNFNLNANVTKDTPQTVEEIDKELALLEQNSSLAKNEIIEISPSYEKIVLKQGQ